MTGKLVLVDGEFDDWWVNFVGGEATLRGALGVVMTHGVWTPPWYNDQTRSAATTASTTTTTSPMVYVAWQDGDWLKWQIKMAGPVEATMEADIDADAGRGRRYGLQRGRRAAGPATPT